MAHLSGICAHHDKPATAPGPTASALERVVFIRPFAPAPYNAHMQPTSSAYRFFAAAAAVFLATAAVAAPLPAASAADRAEARDIFKQLIEINTTDTPKGSVTAASVAMQKHFLDAGFAPEDVHLLGPAPHKQNLVVRIHAAGTPTEKPVLFLCHIDVVEALRSDWTATDPFEFVEKDGYFYGRGTQDMKESDAVLVATFLRLHREGYKPKRDLILALTADEEGGKFNGARWLVTEHRDLVDAAFVINPDSGGVELDSGKPTMAGVEATEKVYSDFQIIATNRGGHSSLPRPDNAIYELTTALNKLSTYSFPFELNAVTRAMYEKQATVEKGQTADDLRAILATPPDMQAAARLSEDPGMNSSFRTTCVATRLKGGHAANALPQYAEANVNCRIFPGRSPEEIRQELIKLFADSKLTVNYVSDGGDISPTAPDRKAIAPPPPIKDVFDPLTRITQQIWPGLPVTPIMENGASDSIYFAQAGIPCYGYSAIALERGDVRAHGRDERLPVDSFWKALDFFYSFTKAVGEE